MIIKPLVISTGEPAGIGPDICVLIAEQINNNNLLMPNEIVLCGDINILRQRSNNHGLNINFHEYQINNQTNSKISNENNSLNIKNSIGVLHIPCQDKVIAGELNVNNSNYVLQMLTTSTKLTAQNYFSAMVTAPIHKGIIAKINPNFTGHTEFLANLLSAPQPVMMLVNTTMRVALITTHLPIAKVSSAITSQLIKSVITVINKDMRNYFTATDVKIVVCGLNPHAGEDGHLGREEIDCINPAIAELQNQGINVIGALSADTVFAPQFRDKYDVIVAMYHDQGLAVIKSHGFGECVNVTLGLPIIRTSVDHGTALSLAGKNKNNIQTNSLYCAISLAKKMAQTKAKQLETS